VNGSSCSTRTCFTGRLFHIVAILDLYLNCTDWGSFRWISILSYYIGKILQIAPIYVEICTLNCMFVFSCIVLYSLYRGVASSRLLAPKKLHYSVVSPVSFCDKYDLIYWLATK